MILMYTETFKNIITIETEVVFSFPRVISHPENRFWYWIFSTISPYYCTFVAVTSTVSPTVMLNLCLMMGLENQSM